MDTNLCIKMFFFFTLNVFLFFNLFYFPINGGGGGGMAHCALLSYANDSGVARIFRRGPKRGSKETEQGEGVDGRDIF